eukprot:1780578-Rhodomonas_salina.1
MSGTDLVYGPWRSRAPIFLPYDSTQCPVLSSRMVLRTSYAAMLGTLCDVRYWPSAYFCVYLWY